MNREDRLHELIAAYQIGNISDAEFAELEDVLKHSSAARELYHRNCRIDGQLRREASGPMPETAIVRRATTASMFGLANWAVAAAVLIAVGVYYSSPPIPERLETIAVLASVEEAAWQSKLPTELGSDLTMGTLKLTSGIATIRFRSGAELTLESPAELTLETAMKARLLSGAAMIEVPDSAVGFVLETPSGYAVDHGTRFAVRVDDATLHSRFEVIEGEISVHNNSTGEKARLKGQSQGATISNDSLDRFDAADELPLNAPMSGVIRIGTRGRATSVIGNNKRDRLPPGILSAKRTAQGSHLWEQRSLMRFYLEPIDLDLVDSASLRLNLVPWNVGNAMRLPKVSRFGIYGLTDKSKRGWKMDCLWEDAPGPEDGVLLGNFEIPRSRTTGSFVVDDPRLLQYLREHPGERVTLILVRETPALLMQGIGPGPAHWFAGDSHPEAAGPSLEFTLKKTEL
ncbi:FecR family protein [Neorhodopirellula lusitana]|uniref:FecR family protein n=1 Tax=Neorhodopirellula lusitana TaxID=445327 RepID=A0ABY1PS44_9BACT|nr:FecR family protein [Neorhodopirellula lusitana]SMP42881.1 FecR family protein [Neorhodopirellula lusitana]